MKRFEIGSRVSEPTYGLGSVLAIEDAFIRIQFDDNTARKFLISLAKLEPSSEPAETQGTRHRDEEEGDQEGRKEDSQGKARGLGTASRWLRSSADARNGRAFVPVSDRCSAKCRGPG
jgi:hypothetical protein